MNDQLIKDLARKAGLIAPYGSDREGLRDFDYRMFAELIVRECIVIVDKWSYDGPYREEGDIIPVKKIKEHFGVEE